MKTLMKQASKIITAALLVLVCASSSFAELQSRKFTPEEKSNDGWKAYLGFSGGNSMITDDGTIFANLRIGIEWNPYIATGIWASTIVSDVRNYKVKHPQMVDYKAFGAQAEFVAFRKDLFSISIPVNIGGGVVYAMNKGDEAFSPEDYFFMTDVSVQFTYKLTKMLDVSVGGGYRVFAGIEENNLDNTDFRTPFGELRFTIKE